MSRPPRDAATHAAEAPRPRAHRSGGAGRATRPLGRPRAWLGVLALAVALGSTALAQVDVRSAELGFSVTVPNAWPVRVDVADDGVSVSIDAPFGDASVVLWSGALPDVERDAFETGGLDGLLAALFDDIARELVGARTTAAFDAEVLRGEARGLAFEAGRVSGRLVASVTGDVAHVWLVSGTHLDVDRILGSADLRRPQANAARGAPRVRATLLYRRTWFDLPAGWTLTHDLGHGDVVAALVHPLGAGITITMTDLASPEAAAYHAASMAERADLLAAETAARHPDAQVTVRPPAGRHLPVVVDVAEPDAIGAVAALLADGDAEGATAIVTIRAHGPLAAAADLADAFELVLATLSVGPGWWRTPLPPPGG